MCKSLILALSVLRHLVVPSYLEPAAPGGGGGTIQLPTLPSARVPLQSIAPLRDVMMVFLAVPRSWGRS